MAPDDMEIDNGGGGAKAVEETKSSFSSSSSLAKTVNAPNFDLEAYAARYSGYTKVARLIYIGQCCKSRELDAYRMAIDVLKQGIDTELCKKVVGLVGGRLGDAYALDTAWIDSVEKKAGMMKERLEGDLQASRTSMAKESIRLGYMDLGDFHYRRGELDNALKSFVRTRDYCHMTRHNIDMCLNVIKVSVDLNSYAHVTNYISKAEHTPDLQDHPKSLTKLKAAAGLAQLHQQHYAAAARKFLECIPDYLTPLAQSAAAASAAAAQGGGAASSSSLGSTTSRAGEACSSTNFSQVIAPEDVAIYGGLCALASFNRGELKNRVVDNIVFKGFLDLVPQMRELIYDFCQSRYGSCLRYLTELQPEFLLDLHLHQHVHALYQKIRERCLLQFFTPYLSVDLRRMSGAFNCPVEELEGEVADLIMMNHLPARIDSENKTLHRRQVNKRDEGYKKVFGMGQDFLREIRSMLLRMSLMEHGLAVEGSGRGGGGGGRGMGAGAMGGAGQEEDPEAVLSLSGLEDNQQDSGMMESS